jgi:predicted transcriptional regulator
MSTCPVLRRPLQVDKFGMAAAVVGGGEEEAEAGASVEPPEGRAVVSSWGSPAQLQALQLCGVPPPGG